LKKYGLLEGQIKENEMGRACGTYGREESIQDFGEET
jgi:hypothetical protein